MAAFTLPGHARCILLKRGEALPLSTVPWPVRLASCSSRQLGPLAAYERLKELDVAISPGPALDFSLVSAANWPEVKEIIQPLTDEDLTTFSTLARKALRPPESWPARLSETCPVLVAGEMRNPTPGGLLKHLIEGWDDLEALDRGARSTFMRGAEWWAAVRSELDVALEAWTVSLDARREAEVGDADTDPESLDVALEQDAAVVLGALTSALTTQAPSLEALTILLRQAMPWLGFGAAPEDMAGALPWLLLIQMAGFRDGAVASS